MKYLSLEVLIIFIFVSFQSSAQSDYISLGARQYDLLDRLEIKLGNDSILNFSTVRPFDRRVITNRLEYVQSLVANHKISLSRVDLYNLDLTLKDNFNWRDHFSDSSLTLRSVFSKSSLTHPVYLGIKTGDFSAYISPVLDLQLGKDNHIDRQLFNNTRGFILRGTLTKGIGYYSYFTSNQERDPLYVQQYVQKFSAVPGAGYTKSYLGDGYDYYDARGGIMFKASKGIDVQFAYDKVFIGNGYRSLILSDFSNNMLFLKVNTRLWKFQYYNLFTQLVGTHPLGPDNLLPKKYMAFHYLDFQATKWLNIGFFEAIMFGRSNGFDLNYLNPVILYNQVNRDMGSPDKTTIGFTIKANVFNNTQIYSQIIINEFLMKEVLHYSRGYWANKQALQLGVKTIDLLGVPNLDLQLEMNLVRPYVYTHYDTVGSFTHYNQPLAHPMGANFREFIGIAKYQPKPKLQLQGMVLYNEQGLDFEGMNFGSNIFESYNTRPKDYGFHIGSGLLAKLLSASFTASYELIPNLFLDGNVMVRRYQVQGSGAFNSAIFNVAFRMNIQRRKFDF